jgi:hypothetical protein
MFWVIGLIVALVAIGIFVEIDNARRRKTARALLNGDSRSSESITSAEPVQRDAPVFASLQSLEAALKRAKEPGAFGNEAQQLAAIVALEADRAAILEQIEASKREDLEASKRSERRKAHGQRTAAERRERDTFVSDDGFHGIAFDRVNRRVGLLSGGDQVVVAYEQLVSSEVRVDQETIVTTSTAGQIGRGLVGRRARRRGWGNHWGAARSKEADRQDQTGRSSRAHLQCARSIAHRYFLLKGRGHSPRSADRSRRKVPQRHLSRYSRKQKGRRIYLFRPSLQ